MPKGVRADPPADRRPTDVLRHEPLDRSVRESRSAVVQKQGRTLERPARIVGASFEIVLDASAASVRKDIRSSSPCPAESFRSATLSRGGRFHELAETDAGRVKKLKNGRSRDRASLRRPEGSRNVSISSSLKNPGTCFSSLAWETTWPVILKDAALQAKSEKRPDAANFLAEDVFDRSFCGGRGGTARERHCPPAETDVPGLQKPAQFESNRSGSRDRVGGGIAFVPQIIEELVELFAHDLRLSSRLLGWGPVRASRRLRGAIKIGPGPSSCFCGGRRLRALRARLRTGCPRWRTGISGIGRSRKELPAWFSASRSSRAGLGQASPVSSGCSF